jgi:hypothetical protein
MPRQASFFFFGWKHDFKDLIGPKKRGQAVAFSLTGRLKLQFCSRTIGNKRNGVTKSFENLNLFLSFFPKEFKLIA